MALITQKLQQSSKSPASKVKLASAVERQWMGTDMFFHNDTTGLKVIGSPVISGKPTEVRESDSGRRKHQAFSMSGAGLQPSCQHGVSSDPPGNGATEVLLGNFVASYELIDGLVAQWLALLPHSPKNYGLNSSLGKTLVDCLGFQHKTKGGYRCILTIMDLLTHFPEDYIHQDS
eukprot:g45181.t1